MDRRLSLFRAAGPLIFLRLPDLNRKTRFGSGVIYLCYLLATG